ncbi:MAG: hypothetical protein EAZ32_09995 [Cytophagia bacterium]|nr:MAG: hypothetical protein EAZ46_05575 [Runella sp.]TAG20280.1 MAG: hypothetical protein EAZ38_10725 [Cytophagales bacterium]TAG39407.1 MAG: hypothetical protein EAZ32_09995 [Cytophagia bacterium]TAG80841.1 MAG: hypothetical protein EAZ22_08520 [Cytophagales bacterium]
MGYQILEQGELSTAKTPLAWSKKMQAAGWPILSEIGLPVRRQKEPKALVFRGQLVKFYNCLHIFVI